MKKPLKDYWYPRTPTKWRRKTAHLTPAQEGLYLRLTDYYMETKSPLPDNDAALARICGISPSEFAPDAPVLRRFYVAKKGQLFNKTCEENLDAESGSAEKRSKAASKAANVKWAKSRDKSMDDMRNASEPHQNSMRKDATEQNRREDKIKEDKKERKKEIEGASAPPPPLELLPIPAGLKPEDFFLPDWVDPVDWADFAEMRKRLRKPLTTRAAKAIIKKLENFKKENHDVSTILEQSIRNSWQDVYAPKVDYQSGGGARQNQKPSNWDKTKAAAQMALESIRRDEQLDASGEGAQQQWLGSDFGGEPEGEI